jgi:hypothetical protein
MSVVFSGTGRAQLASLSMQTTPASASRTPCVACTLAKNNCVWLLVSQNADMMCQIDSQNAPNMLGSVEDLKVVQAGST